MSQVHVLNHPLIQHKLTIMRKKETGPKEFRELLEEISTLMVYEVTRDLPTEEVEIETPICKMKSKVLAGKKLGIVPILRAGLGMVDGVTNLIPACRVGHIGLYRDPVTLNPVEYYCKLPADAQERELIVLDPMLATGGSAVLNPRGLKRLRELGKIVYLRHPYEEIARRIPNLATRGITLAPGQTLKDLYDYRTPIYEQAADITVDAENCTIEQTARAIQGAAKD